MSYDTEYLGTENKLHPANEVEIEISEQELYEQEMAEMRRYIDDCKRLVRQMAEIENDELFQVKTSSPDKTHQYIMLRTKLQHTLKWKL